MYEEEKKNSFIKDFIIKLLYMFLFLFLFMWLYPAPKVNLDDVKVKVDKSELQPLFEGVFNDNIASMKNAARNYYTIERLPKNNGDSDKMTLQEMLSKKLLSPFVDANGKACDANSSYVEVTRISSAEYTLKVNLSCSDKTDYIVETIGCTSVCPGCIATPTAATTTRSTTSNSGASRTVTVVQRPTTSQPSNSKPNNNGNNNGGGNSGTTPKPQEETKTYKYVKDTTTWELNDSWTTVKKTGDDVRVADTRYVYGDYTYATRTATFRTMSWVANWDRNSNYSIYLNSLPSDATNIRITSSSKFSDTSNRRSYVDSRRRCEMYMVGYGCSSAGSLEDAQVLSAPVASFNYNISISGRTVHVTTTTYSAFSGDTQYIEPIKFTVSYRTRGEREQIKQYKYEYKKTTTDVKYSTSKNDTNLLNSGYTFAGEK